MAKKKISGKKNKKVKKIKGKISKPRLKKKNRKPDQKNSSDVIFDSKIGETDALFVSAPAPQADAVINPAVQGENPQEAKKSFWKRLLNFWAQK